MLKTVGKITGYAFLSLLAILLVLAGIMTGMYLSADMNRPEAEVDISTFVVMEHEGYRECAGSRLRRSDSGLWEAYLCGDPVARGAAYGAMTRKLLYFQESVFVEQIRRIVPSDGYLKFLRFILISFNRNLGKNIPLEFREEIYALSLSCTHEFDAIGTPYERQLNYHAAHDIGHAMQEYMLVGCSSFGTWGTASADSTLMIGRNFDFWAGDDFAINKVVIFCAPSEGYRFASVSWPGMMGVLSGMNERGLTVTINAAKGALPKSSAMPISLLAREILQYASNIKEAMAIAEKRRTFVSELLLIGSAADGRAAIIEKTPEHTALYESDSERIICTNHFQSECFGDDRHNAANIAGSDSPYRFARISQLLEGKYAFLDETGAAAILRDTRGLGGRDIGLTNEKSLNQSIAHHSVIFKPVQGLMWVSTGPWQSGGYVCYDLNAVFAGADFSGEIRDASRSIAADSAFLANDYPRVLLQRERTAAIRAAIKEGRTLEESFIDGYLTNNPEYYYAWKVAADYYAAAGDRERAAECLRTALNKEIPRQGDRRVLEKELKKMKR